MESKCVKVRLKPGSVGRVREWAAELNGRSDEVLATLRDEGVVVEAAFLDQTSEGDYLIYYMKVHDLDAAREIGRRSHHSIDDYHRRFKADVMESAQLLDALIDFENLEGSSRGG